MFRLLWEEFSWQDVLARKRRWEQLHFSMLFSLRIYMCILFSRLGPFEWNERNTCFQLFLPRFLMDTYTLHLLKRIRGPLFVIFSGDGGKKNVLDTAYLLHWCSNRVSSTEYSFLFYFFSYFFFIRYFCAMLWICAQQCKRNHCSLRWIMATRSCLLITFIHEFFSLSSDSPFYSVGRTICAPNSK